MTEYTKGPWVLVSNGLMSAVYCDDESECLTDPYIGDPNARLISAAPDMLEALEEAEARLTMMGFRLNECLIMRMREIIAKAKGQ